MAKILTGLLLVCMVISAAAMPTITLDEMPSQVPYVVVLEPTEVECRFEELFWKQESKHIASGYCSRNRCTTISQSMGCRD